MSNFVRNKSASFLLLVRRLSWSSSQYSSDKRESIRQGRLFVGSTCGMLAAVAVAPIATKPSVQSEPTFALEFGNALMPHPDKVHKGGEDAMFANHAVSAFGIADGVGAWSTMGVDPAKFSRAIMRFSEEAFLRESKVSTQDMRLKGVSSTNSEILTPVDALRIAYDQVKKRGIRGSCTALVGVLRGQSLYMANLGDSGAMVLSRRSQEPTSLPTQAGELISPPPSPRIIDSSSEDDSSDRFKNQPLKVIYKTVDQQHRFNCPYQLGIESSDQPEAASLSTHTVHEGDIIIAGSDGLWDNLFQDEIVRLAETSKDPQELAFIIASQAQLRASKTCGSKTTPFAVNAMEAGVLYEGGKMDDITVVVARVVKMPEGSIPAKL